MHGLHRNYLVCSQNMNKDATVCDHDQGQVTLKEAGRRGMSVSALPSGTKAFLYTHPEICFLLANKPAVIRQLAVDIHINPARIMARLIMESFRWRNSKPILIIMRYEERW